ncbi:hypothetical protein K438DRAFT_1957376 [Mycena galopus ATCC 62051]|nr:hypothetical protein K438DRAFT_1957376 [Mycena galopus ATCC 62051]
MPIAHTMSPRPRDAESTLPFNIFTTVGALEIGIMVALILSGMVGAQVISYFRRGRDDPKVVGICGSLEICHSIAICHTLYTVTVIQYGQPELLLVPPLSLDLTMVMSGFMGPLEQGWFAYRLYRLTKTLTLPVFCMCLTIMRFIGLMGLSFIALHQYPLPEYTQRAGWLIECIVIISAVLDTTLVGALCYFLSSWRLDKSRVMHKIITQIMTWTIESGAVTVVGALGLLVTFLTMKNNMVYIGFFVVQPKCDVLQFLDVVIKLPKSIFRPHPGFNSGSFAAPSVDDRAIGDDLISQFFNELQHNGHSRH